MIHDFNPQSGDYIYIPVEGAWEYIGYDRMICVTAKYVWEENQPYVYLTESLIIESLHNLLLTDFERKYGFHVQRLSILSTDFDKENKLIKCTFECALLGNSKGTMRANIDLKSLETRFH